MTEHAGTPHDEPGSAWNRELDRVTEANIDTDCPRLCGAPGCASWGCQN